MIFKQVQQVLDGTKTQTRRPVKRNEDFVYSDGRWLSYSEWGPFTTLAVAIFKTYLGYNEWKDVRIKWKVGNTYAIQPGRGKKSIGRIRITKIRRERLWTITPLDILAEGIAPIRVTPNRFMAEVREEDFATLWNSLYRKPYRWEDNPEVWVLEFEREA